MVIYLLLEVVDDDYIVDIDCELSNIKHKGPYSYSSLVFLSSIFFWTILESSLSILAACLPSVNKLSADGNVVSSIRRVISIQSLRSYASRQPIITYGVERDSEGTSGDKGGARPTFREGLELATQPKLDLCT